MTDYFPNEYLLKRWPNGNQCLVKAVGSDPSVLIAYCYLGEGWIKAPYTRIPEGFRGPTELISLSIFISDGEAAMILFEAQR